MKLKPAESRNPWLWVPSTYFAEGIPYFIVIFISVIMYKKMGISNTDIALYTGWLYLPFVIKPLWSPFVEMYRTKRFWVLTAQVFLGAGLAGLAFLMPLPGYFSLTLAMFWILAFAAATQDVSVDGFYMLGLSKHDQAWFVGIRSTFFRFASITAQGLLVMFAGLVESHTGLPKLELTATLSSSTPAEVRMLPPPDSVSAFFIKESKPRIRAYPTSLDISAAPAPAGSVDSLFAFAREWNSRHGFAQPGEQPNGKPLNAVAVYLYYSGTNPPEEDVTFTFGRETGTASLGVAEGSRITFTKENWNLPAIAIIQANGSAEAGGAALFLGRSGNIRLSWMLTFFITAGIFILLFLYHFFVLPYPASDVPAPRTGSFWRDFLEMFIDFFRKPGVWQGLLFLLFYRFAKSQLVKIIGPFLLDSREAGGLALSTTDVGLINGTLGVIGLTIGGIIGGFVAAKQGLKYWVWWFALAINIPNIVYVYLAVAMPEQLWIVGTCAVIEQLGYGFGFSGYVLYMLYIAQGKYKTTHYALCAGFMAMGMMVPGMISGWIQQQIGYVNFFIWIMLATIPSFIATALIRVDPSFGKKTEEAK